MATAPVKSQPLHNFSLPSLRWGHKIQMNTNHRYSRFSETAAKDSPPPPSEHHRSSPSEQESDGGGGGSRNDSESGNGKLSVGSRSAQRNWFSFASCSSQGPQAAALEREGNEVEGEREKKKKVRDVVKSDESLAKPWNLRPRKAVVRTAVEIGRVSKNGELLETPPTATATTELPSAENLPKSMRLRGFVEGHGSEKKRKFWIALSRDEIEEDVYAMTGLKPAWRPKKRSKTVQKLVDNVFPGLYLTGITAESYRV